MWKHNQAGFMFLQDWDQLASMMVRYLGNIQTGSYGKYNVSMCYMMSKKGFCGDRCMTSLVVAIPYAYRRWAYPLECRAKVPKMCHKKQKGTCMMVQKEKCGNRTNLRIHWYSITLLTHYSVIVLTLIILIRHLKPTGAWSSKSMSVFTQS